MRSPVSRRALGECNAITSPRFGRSELTFASTLEDQPGKPTQNARVESFHGRLREELFGAELVSELVRCTAKNRGLADRLQRRTSSQQFGIQTPKEFAAQAASFYTAERGTRNSNAVPCPSRSPIPAQTREGRIGNRKLSYSYVNESRGQVTF
jgi:hypothetical protein